MSSSAGRKEGFKRGVFRPSNFAGFIPRTGGNTTVVVIQGQAGGVTIAEPTEIYHADVVATSALGSLSGLPTIDGVDMAIGARVLVTAQESEEDNGLYEIGTTWERLTGFTKAFHIQVVAGATGLGTLWYTINGIDFAMIELASSSCCTVSVRTITNISFDGNMEGPWPSSITDGVALVDGDRVLVWREGGDYAADNGIYIYRATGNAERTSDTITAGLLVSVTEGAHAGTIFQCANSYDPTGSDPVFFVMTSALPYGAAGGGLAGNYPNPGIAANAITTEKIANSAVTTDKLAGNAVTNDKVHSITYEKISNPPTIPTELPPTGPAGGALDGEYPDPTIANNAITTDMIADNAITNGKIESMAYEKLINPPTFPTELPPSGPAGGDLTGDYPNPTIADGAITTEKLAPDAVTADKIADGAVTGEKLEEIIEPGSGFLVEYDKHGRVKNATHEFPAEAVPVMVGATNGTNGASGAVPQPPMNDFPQVLMSNGQWSSNIFLMSNAGAVIQGWSTGNGAGISGTTQSTGVGVSASSQIGATGAALAVIGAIQIYGRTITSSGAINARDSWIGIGFLEEPVDLTLPPASSMIGQVLIIKDEAGSVAEPARVVAIYPDGEDLIDGDAGRLMQTPYSVLRLRAHSYGWAIW